MANAPSAPLAWLKRIGKELQEPNPIPLFGNAPPFDWSRASSLLASRFGLSTLSLKPEKQEWKEPGEWKKGLGPDLFVVSITSTPLEGGLFWIMSQEDIARLTSFMLNGKAKSRAFTSEILQEGFYRYLLLESLDAVQSLKPLEKMTLSLEEESIPSEERLFCVDVEISLDDRSCWGRLAVSSRFQKSWINHFAKMPSEYIPTELAKQTLLPLKLKTGSVILHQNEWKKLEKGDFITLDHGSYDARRGSGLATLMLGRSPLFNVKIKQNKIELVDYAFIYEDAMEQKPSKNVPSGENPEGEIVAIKDLPFFVTVELAQYKITLDELMHLHPGNTLELPVHPEQGVSLTVNGQQIGRGELVHLGETLGVRILEMA